MSAVSTKGKEPEVVKDSSGDVEMTEADQLVWTVGVKPRQPRAFSGNRLEIEAFLYSLEVYFSIADPHDQMSEEQKTLSASSYLEGSASRWFQTYLKDQITKANCLKKTRSMFADFKAFKQELQNVFGITNEVRRAELQLAKLRQKAGVVSYSTEFQRLYHVTGWGDEAGQTTYYVGLKGNIKNQLALRENQLSSFQELMLIAAKIDDRFQERYWENKFEHGTRKGHGKHKYKKERRDDSYGPTLMDVDIARVKKFPLY